MVGMAVGADRQVAGAGAAAAAVQLQAEHGMGVEAEAEAARRVAGGELEAQALGGFLAVAVALAPGLEAVAPGVVRAVAVVAVEVVGAGEELQFAVLDEAPSPAVAAAPSESVPATRPANTARLRFCIYCFLPPECQVGAVSEVAPQAACVSLPRLLPGPAIGRGWHVQRQAGSSISEVTDGECGVGRHPQRPWVGASAPDATSPQEYAS